MTVGAGRDGRDCSRCGRLLWLRPGEMIKEEDRLRTAAEILLNPLLWESWASMLD